MTDGAQEKAANEVGTAQEGLSFKESCGTTTADGSWTYPSPPGKVFTSPGRTYGHREQCDKAFIIDLFPHTTFLVGGADHVDVVWDDTMPTTAADCGKAQLWIYTWQNGVAKDADFQAAEWHVASGTCSWAGADGGTSDFITYTFANPMAINRVAVAARLYDNLGGYGRRQVQVRLPP